MPLKHSSSPKAFKSNLKTELAHGKPMKQSLAIAYSTKRQAKKKGMATGGSAGCADCSYAEGGEVDALCSTHATAPGNDNEEMHPEQGPGRSSRINPGISSEADSDMERDEPELMPSTHRKMGQFKGEESLDLVGDVMGDRKRRMMAKGGSVESYEGEDTESMQIGDDESGIDAPTGKYETMDQDEMDAPLEDGRDSRGLNLEPVHTMEDDEHDQSDASLVAAILKDRKTRRRG